MRATPPRSTPIGRNAPTCGDLVAVILQRRRIVRDEPLPRSPSERYSMAMPAETGRRWTAREVRELIEAAPLATPRYELVDGELLVTSGPHPIHQRAASSSSH